MLGVESVGVELEGAESVGAELVVRSWWCGVGVNCQCVKSRCEELE